MIASVQLAGIPIRDQDVLEVSTGCSGRAGSSICRGETRERLRPRDEDPRADRRRPRQHLAGARVRAFRDVLGGAPRPPCPGLLEIAKDPKAHNRDRIAASREMLDRGWGKAVGFADIDGGGRWGWATSRQRSGA